MADQPIGISFIPTAQNQANGPQAASAQGEIGRGPNTDLAQAYKILSLRLPTVVGAQAPVKASLLTSPGSSGVLPGGMDPYAALFQALLKSMLSSGPDAGSSLPGSSAPSTSTAPQDGGLPSPGRTVPRITVPQQQFPTGVEDASPAPTAPQRDYQDFGGAY
jgi:hypothetical protein